MMAKSYHEDYSWDDEDLCCSHCEQFVDSEDELTECESCGYYRVCPDCRNEALNDEDLCAECREDEDDEDDEDDY